MYESNLTLEHAEKKQSELSNKLSCVNRGKIPVEKRSLLNNAGLFLSAREKILNNFKSKIFPAKDLD